MRIPSFINTLLIASLFICAPLFADDFGPRNFDHVKNKWTAIVAAYEPEIEAIDSAFSKMDDAKIEKVVTIRGVKYQIGSYKGEPVVIFTTGISVPNAAMTIQMALDYFPIDKLVMMGIAGGINPKFSPGDISVPERWYFHDESVYVNPKEGGMSGEYELPDYYVNSLEYYLNKRKSDPGVPDYTNIGFIHPAEMWVIKQGWDQPQKMSYFSATPALVEMTKAALDALPPITMPSGKPIKVEVGGNGVTGSVFVDNAEYRDWLRKVFTAEVAEMESAAVGQVCFVNEVDWIIIRSVSDLAGGQQGKNVENVFDAIASGTGTKLMLGVLDQIVMSETTLKSSK